jgi:hypothetical protein
MGTIPGSRLYEFRITNMKKTKGQVKAFWGINLLVLRFLLVILQA